MDSALRRLLDAHDDPVGCEIPGNDWSNFPAAALAESIRSIQRALNSELGISFELDGNVQDASFCGELHVRRSGAGVIVSESAIRFSNFGHLYTLHSAMPAIPDRYPVGRIKAIVELHSWTYVPADELEELYDGKNVVLRDGRNTWWIRFFDYL